jgi:tetratricopeptide (TPR) repeat protein
MAQLFRANDQKSLWAEAYDRDSTNLLSIQRDVAYRIAESLSLKVLPDAASFSPAPATVNSAAYDDYLKGIFACNRSSLEGEQGAIQLLRRAVSEDPGFARAYAALASCYGASFHFGFLSSDAAHQQAKTAALKALELDDSLEDAHLALANILYQYDWDWAGAEREFRRALEINPSSASAHRFYSGYLVMVGRYDEALTQAHIAQQLDPLSLDTRSMSCLVLNASRQYGRSIEECQKILELDAGSVLPGYYVASAHLYSKDYAQALEELKRLRNASEDSSHAYLLVAAAIANASQGNQAEVKKELNELIQLSSRSLVSPYELAEVYIHMGDKEQALAHLKEALDHHSYDLVYLANDPDFDPLRSDPRFQAIENRLGYPGSAFGATSRQNSN